MFFFVAGIPFPEEEHFQPCSVPGWARVSCAKARLGAGSAQLQVGARVPSVSVALLILHTALCSTVRFGS